MIVARSGRMQVLQNGIQRPIIQYLKLVLKSNTVQSAEDQ